MTTVTNEGYVLDNKINSPPFDLRGRSFLVTGGAGFIGSHTVRRLVAEGARVRVLDLFTGGSRANLADVIDEVELVQGDVSDMATVRKAVMGMSYVIHLAALVSVRESVARPERNFKTNVIGTHNLLIASRDMDVQRFVFGSSCTVYGEQPPPHHEELNPQILSPYASSKLCGEQMCRLFTYVYGLPTIALRYYNVFGPFQSSYGAYSAEISRLIRQLLEGKEPVVYRNGHQTRDFVYVDDVVQANLLACSPAAPIGEKFNIGSGHDVSGSKLMEILSDLVGRPVESHFAQPRGGELRRSYASIARAEEKLRYRVTVGLREGLKKTVAWYRQLQTAGY